MQAVSVTPEPFTALIRRHQAGLWRYLRALGASPDEAEEVVQDVFVAVHSRFDPSAVGAGLLRRLARDRLIDRLRSERRRTASLLRYAQELDWTDADDESDGGPWLDALRTCLSQLDAQARSILDEFYARGRSREEIAARRGLQEGSVKSRLHRIRQALRRCVERRIQGDE